MDFFQYQDNAHKKTSLLVFYFCLAVISIILMVYISFQSAFVAITMEGDFGVNLSKNIWNQQVFIWVLTGTISLIVGGSVYKIKEIGHSGETIAVLLGGRKINRYSGNLNEKKLINVVEEMAIASGCPVPSVFILDSEMGINAFAAGFTLNDAVVAVTKGALNNLNRDELQGVIAHEFSHIFNGDMRLNGKLIGILHGILLIGVIGMTILRTLSRSRPRKSSGKGDAGIVVFMFLGVALWIIGYVGVFFGKIIKSSISREREFLADASSAQFTRNPLGLASALKKIAAFSQGSQIQNLKAEEASHMFFGNALKKSFFNLLSTHPPVLDRIKRLDPYFDGKMTEPEIHYKSEVYETKIYSFFNKGEKSSSKKIKISSNELMSRIGTVDFKSIQFASDLISHIPVELSDFSRDSYSARSLIFALLLDENPEIQNKQINWLKDNIEEQVVRELQVAYALLQKSNIRFRLPLVELCLPALKQLSFNQYSQFKFNVEQIVHIDNKVSLIEFVLTKVIYRNLDSFFRLSETTSCRHYSLKPFVSEIEILISILSAHGHKNETSIREAFKAGIDAFKIRNSNFSYRKFESYDFKELDKILDIFKAALPILKKQVIEACMQCVLADKQIAIEEFELLRAIGEVLEVPIPLTLPQ
ncbi:MAG: hypothetical protein ACD_79C00429G0003 [uncultured bacterium]|nr:MAG: hypothetical protein ACD_79C00429G0003 [uncultured bacterium]